MVALGISADTALVNIRVDVRRQCSDSTITMLRYRFISLVNASTVAHGYWPLRLDCLQHTEQLAV